VTILELPFRERVVRDLLHLDQERAAPDPEYAGYGWARVGQLWLDDALVEDALVLALCNPHRATLQRPSDATFYYANGDVESWLDHDRGDRIRLASEHGWIRRDA